jgi:hypothetical protein
MIIDPISDTINQQRNVGCNDYLQAKVGDDVF